MMYERDEAVSSVVGLMLILAIIATLLAIYSATYLPGLKQQSEIEHTYEVQDAFARFGADIEHAVFHKRACQFSEPFALGGGDVLLSPGKSSGTLSVREEEPLAEVFFNETGRAACNATLVSIAYRPSFTSWEPQGYTWRYGFINVTRGAKETPLLMPTMDDVQKATKDSAFAGSFVDIQDRTPQGSPGCTDLAVTLVRMHAGEQAAVTGNGMANLNLVSTTGEPRLNRTGYLELRLPMETAAPGFAEPVNRTVTAACKDLPGYQFRSEGTMARHILHFPGPVNVTVQTIDIEVNAR
jgi:hypothetical protein